jgi:D-alanine-D-alanine ligase
LKLAVLFGGTSGEREVSLASADTVLGALRDGGYAPRAIDTGHGALVAVARWRGPRLQYPARGGGEDGVTQGLLQALGVVGTGSNVLGSALAMDKLRSKQLWRGAESAHRGLLPELGPDTDADRVTRDLGPAFIKPVRGQQPGHGSGG